MAQDTFISGLAESAATQATSGLIGAGMGLILQKHNDRRQINQQRKLTQMQEEANKRMGVFNREQQLQMWKDTNYAPQMKELEKAGLNPGLIYGMGGAGGATTGNPGGAGVSGASAPMGGGEIMGMMMNKAQIDLIKAQTENIKADTTNKPLTGKNIEASTQSITQGIYNQRTQQALMQAQTLATNINAENTQTQTKLIEDQIQIMDNDVEISNATKESKIITIRQESINSILHAEATKAGIQLTQEQTRRIAIDLEQGWKDLDIKEKHQKIQQKFLQENIDFMPIDRAIKGIDMITNLIPRRGIQATHTYTEKFDKQGNVSYETRTTTPHKK